MGLSLFCLYVVVEEKKYLQSLSSVSLCNRCISTRCWLDKQRSTKKKWSAFFIMHIMEWTAIQEDLMAQLNKPLNSILQGFSLEWGKVGKNPSRECRWIYADANVEDLIQIPWQEIERIGATYPDVTSRHWNSYQRILSLLQKTLENF